MTSDLPPIRPNEREELLQLLLQGDIELGALDDLCPPDEPMSFAQRRLWFLNVFSGGEDTSYNVPFALRLRGRLSFPALQSAFNELAERHDMLRAYFPIKDGEPVQHTAKAAEIRIGLLEADLSNLSALINEHANQTFVLGRGPLISVQLLRIEQDHHVLLLNFHHIIADGWSLGILVRELSAFYRHHLLAEPILLGPTPIRYSSFAERQRRMLEGPEGQRQLCYWLKRLEGAPLLLNLAAGPRPSLMSGEGGQVRFEIPGEVRDRLRAQSSERGATMFMALMAAFTSLLHQLSGQTDILVGSPVAGRGSAELEGVVGCFVNTVLFRSQMRGTGSFAEHLEQIRGQALAAYENQDIPFEVLVEHLQPIRSLSHTPVFQVMMALQNIPIGTFSLPELTIEPVEQDLVTAKFDLNLNIMERPDRLVAVLEYNADIFSAPRAAAVVEHFLTILTGLAERGLDTPIAVIRDLEQNRLEALADASSETEQDQSGGEVLQLRFPKELPGQAGECGTVSVVLSSGLHSTLLQFARSLASTPDRILAAGLAVLLFRLTQQSSFLLGLKSSAGLCQDGLWRGWHCAITSYANFRQVIEAACEAFSGAKTISLAPSEASIALSPPCELAMKGAFSASLSFDSDSALNPANSPLHCVFDLTGDEIVIQVSFDASVGTRSNAVRIVRMLETLLTNLIASADRPVSQIGLLTDDERRHVLHGLNEVRSEFVPEASLAEPFEAWCAGEPHALALIGEDRELTYRELNDAASRLAHHLHNVGIKQGDRVGIFMERSVDMVIAIYAVAKAGASYLPIDLSWPHDRIVDVIADAGLRCIVTQSDLSGRVSGIVDFAVDVEALADTLAAMPNTPIAVRRTSGGLAYVMYTSGSTGRPKAVQYPVDASIASILWLQRQYPVEPGDTHLFKTPCGFDVSIWEIFWPLYFGGTLVVCDTDGHRDPTYLRKLIDRHKVTCANFVPSMLQVLLDEMPQGSCGSLRWVLSGGEALSPRLRDRCHSRLPDAELVNLYGPTETHSVTDIVVPRAEGSDFVPLGRPSAAYRLYVLDEHYEPVPVGVTGELYIGGKVGLAHGYLHSPGLTADRFVPDPFGLVGGRMYRSGDLCRYFADGVLEHLGRSDRQVKIRGIRIEPGEIEAALLAERGIQSAVVAPIGDGADRKLVGFVVAEDANCAAQVHRGIAGRLPRYMLPAAVIPVDRLPLSTNGKVDHHELTKIWAAHTGTPVEPGSDRHPTSDFEKRVKELYEQVLNCTDVGIDQDFFEIGGHSMLTFRLMSACEEEFGIVLSMHALFTYTTVRSLAAEIESVRCCQQRSLISLSGDATTARHVVFLIHGADGTVAPLRHLAKHLQGSAAVYAFQAPGLDGVSDVPRSVEAYAERYVRAADQVAASAKIVLVGWSLGGAIAVEMARLWSEQGLKVESTVMLDTFLLGTRSALQQRDAVAELEALGLLANESAEFEASFERMNSALKNNLRAFVRYRPQNFSGRVELIKASAGFPNLEGALVDSYDTPARGWADCLGNLVINEVDADHFEMLSTDVSGELAKKLLGDLGLRTKD